MYLATSTGSRECRSCTAIFCIDISTFLAGGGCTPQRIARRRPEAGRLEPPCSKATGSGNTACSTCAQLEPGERTRVTARMHMRQHNDWEWHSPSRGVSWHLRNSGTLSFPLLGSHPIFSFLSLTLCFRSPTTVLQAPPSPPKLKLETKQKGHDIPGVQGEERKAICSSPSLGYSIMCFRADQNKCQTSPKDKGKNLTVSKNLHFPHMLSAGKHQAGL